MRLEVPSLFYAALTASRPQVFVALILVGAVMAALSGHAALAATGSRFTWIGQKTATDCGRAILASVIAGLHSVDAESAYRSIRPGPSRPDIGFSVDELIARAASLHPEHLRVEMTLVAPQGVTILGSRKKCSPHSEYYKNLAAVAEAGHPIIVRRSGAGPAHYLLIVGHAGGEFSLQDPSRRGIEKMSVTRLNALMCASDYLALVGSIPASRPGQGKSSSGTRSGE